MEHGVSSVTGRGPTPAELDALTQHVVWVRRLAHQLVRDPAQADDLAQDACLAALQGPRCAAGRAGERGPLRVWLATVVRNGARQDWRRAERRTERERSSARSEAQPSAAELIERVATHRAVVEAVLALDEPYRATLLQRYFEDLSPGEIAARTGVPIATVKSRLQRGLVRLREALGGPDSGGRSMLLQVLAPLLVDRTVAPVPAALADAAPLAATRTSAPTPASETGAAPDDTVAPDAATAPEASRTFDVRGRVLGANAEPMPGAALAFEPSDGSAPIGFESDRSGAFVLRGLSVGGRIGASGERHVTLFAALVSALHDDAELVVVVAPRVALGGRVVDVAGRPIAEALVQVRAPEGFRARFEHVMDHSGGLDVAVRTDDDGQFALAAPALTDGELVATHERYIEARRPLPLADQPELRLELRLGGPPLEIVGRVVDPAGSPVIGAAVWARDATVLEFGRGDGLSVEAVLDGRETNWEPTLTDDDGRFVLTGLVDADYVVVAHDPDTLLRVEREVRASSVPVTLVMDSTQLWRRVAGKVVDRTGRPVPGVRVHPMTDAFFMRYQGRVVSTSHACQPQGTETDEEGHFELENMPRELVYLRIDGEDVVSDDWGRRAEGGIAALSDGRVEELKVVVRLRVHMQVHLADPSEADALRVLTADGTPIVINLIQAGARREQQVMPLVGGRSEVLTVDDSSATLVLEREGKEVRRVPLALQRGRLNRVDA